jgi:sulfotransferase
MMANETPKQIEPKTYYFMAGLPRAGSTLLSAILNQNPRIHSGPSSPVVPTMLALETSLSQDELYLAYPKPQIASQMIASIMPQFYLDVDKPVIIDKNRSWVNRLHYITGYFGIQPKVICPVRSIDEILASFIAMQRRNLQKVDSVKLNFLDEMLVKSNLPLTDDNRCELMASPMGILGQSYEGLKQCIMQGQQRALHFVEYDDLLDNPEDTMQKIYDFLEEDYFKHDFTNVVNIHQENDGQVYGMADMHEVRKTLGRRGINPAEILSENIINKCKNAEFWRTMNDEIPQEEFLPDDDPVVTQEESTSIIGA